MVTPIHLITKGDNSIYIKREDFIPFSFGGNKARKSFYFFKELDSLACDCVVTYGSSSSNHCRIIANMAVAKQLPCYIMSPEEASEETYNSRMMELFGAKIKVVPVSQVHDTIEGLLAELRAEGKNPYFIEGGGHGKWGTQAFVDCYEEILQYEHTENIHFDYIFFASGTGTTQAGLVCGQLLNNDQRKIVGISIARKNPRGRQVVIDSITSYLEIIGKPISGEKIDEATIFIDDYVGDGYGNSNEDVKQTIEMMLLKFGIPMDKTYTGKAYSGMLDLIRRTNISGKNILFIHTGGAPLFFDSI